MLQRLVSTNITPTNRLPPPYLSRYTPRSSFATDSGSKQSVLETAPKPGDYEYEDPKSEADVVNITYILRDGRKGRGEEGSHDGAGVISGTEKKIRGKVGDNVMFLAHR